MSLNVHLQPAGSSEILYGKRLGSPNAMLEPPHFVLRCLSTEDIFFRLLTVSSKYG
uniref:Uncharacterized protein n=1 Tax=Rhizophora mucronata TaxID=61149 RepID=A0A2P2J106_RHIMU